MKKLLATLLILVACIHVNAQESRQIRISTDRTDLILKLLRTDVCINLIWVTNY